MDFGSGRREKSCYSNILKLFFERPRPDIVPHAARVFTLSFPSGHATLSAVTYLTLGALLASLHEPLRFKIYFLSLAILLTIAVGISRIYLGVHYPTDVLAGWCLGAAWRQSVGPSSTSYKSAGGSSRPLQVRSWHLADIQPALRMSVSGVKRTSPTGR